MKTEQQIKDIREGLEKDPVDAVAYVELALEILKEELLTKIPKR